MKELRVKLQRKNRRTIRVRRKIQEQFGRPRLSIFRSNKHLYAQIIDDAKGVTLLAVTEKELDIKDSLTKVQKAEQLGGILAKKAAEKRINKVVFDKGPYRYHGRVKIFADAARSGGLQF